ncbi:hypothetical protein K469DRAFT_693917 [Zopfia rhizophila CBS 207.26]|uniref:Uncharacterized protein n=1 Tax=Zopfia rhizophila CBS 207.26 TaxID=1314779 RepID=A0A6A6DPG0_9PEZI|nr:hypothetical protein K469DRAFT_693917 [Zopfia rhizophila CBS 207.26]
MDWRHLGPSCKISIGIIVRYDDAECCPNLKYASRSFVKTRGGDNICIHCNVHFNQARKQPQPGRVESEQSIFDEPAPTQEGPATIFSTLHSDDEITLFTTLECCRLGRQAMMQRSFGEDDHDMLDSNSSIPPGAAPRPDLTDKKLPHILHSYFVRLRHLTLLVLVLQRG